GDLITKIQTGQNIYSRQRFQLTIVGTVLTGTRTCCTVSTLLRRRTLRSPTPFTDHSNNTTNSFCAFLFCACLTGTSRVLEPKLGWIAWDSGSAQTCVTPSLQSHC